LNSATAAEATFAAKANSKTASQEIHALLIAKLKTHTTKSVKQILRANPSPHRAFRKFPVTPSPQEIQRRADEFRVSLASRASAAMLIPPMP
jgi:hypothetical protein